MANLDVDDVLLDPDFFDSTLICTRLTQRVTTDGIARNSAVASGFSGVVFPKEGSALVRMPDGSRVHQTISIVTQFALQPQSINLAADLVTWQGNQYTVMHLDSYSNYGRGFVEATAELLPLSGGVAA